MMTVQVLLGISLFALLILHVHGVPVKGAPSHYQSNSDTQTGVNVASHRGAATGHTAPVSYGFPAGVLKQDPHQSLQAEPGFDSMSSIPVAAISTGYVPVQAEYYIPGYDAVPQQAGAAQSSLPEAKWAIAPQAFEEPTSQAQGSSAPLPSPEFPAPPALQSGETSNVLKEAELGNYQQQTEEFGYPADRMGPGLGFPLVAAPGLGVGGLWGYPSPYPFPYPDFDYRLLYGLYPPGTYTTFSRNHEKGTDYFQDIHYLKEHGSDYPEVPQDPGSGQQKVFPGTL